MITDARLRGMAGALATAPGVVAVVLGGSRARGTHHPGSDVDLGVYYDWATLDLDTLTEVTAQFHDGGRAEVVGPGGWGPWVDGGAWLTVDGTPVDWILRDVARVREQCDRAVAGQFAFHPQPGHPLGFLDVSYAGEVATGIPLADPCGVIGDLRAGLLPYPHALRSAFIGNLWQAGFLVAAARKGLPRDDVAYVLMACTTALMLCAHAWHAAAGSWVTNEKGLVPDVQRLDVDSHGFAARARGALELGEAGTLADLVERVAGLVDECTRVLDAME